MVDGETRRRRQKQSGDKPVGDYFEPRANRGLDARICRRIDIEMDLRRIFSTSIYKNTR